MKRPNVIFIICDDLAWGDLACHGNPVPTKTPQLDAMYAASTRLTRYCSGPLCTPARAGILTGRWHLRTRAFDTYCGRATLDPGEPTIAATLGAAGYATGCFGKWHLGDNYPSRPMDLGFDESLVHLAGGIGQPGDRYENHEREDESYFDPVVVRHGMPEQSNGYCSDVFTDECLDFITRRAGEPFFAYLAFNAPHTPLQIADQWADPYREAGVNEAHARIYGMVSNIDHNVGRVQAKLAELNLADNTLVVFTSDHGPCGSAQNQEAPAGERHRWNGGLRGIKGSVYQGGVQVPSLWHWPGHVPAGRDVDCLAATVDVLPTLADLCGAQLPEQPVDGVSLAAQLTERPGTSPERTVFMQWHRGDAPVRYRNYAAITQRWKVTRPHESAADELYDLARDPHETADIAVAHPDVVERLRQEYEVWFDDVGTTRGARTFDPPTVYLGSDEENPVLLTQNDWRTLDGAEGWRSDGLRGYWRVYVRQGAGPFNVRIRLRQGVPAGTVHLALDEAEYEVALPPGTHVVDMVSLDLPSGTSRLEAWLHTDDPAPDARHGRFIPALYVEVEGVRR
ncbi:MAG TPA: arylsulfatase [Candidatus Latescibacteria bacterium]|nr:arylsulfatase [Candidatus Latescibacterota bacterium]